MTNTCMTMKLINILNENSITKDEMIDGLKGLKIPFEYGTVILENGTVFTDHSEMIKKYKNKYDLTINVTLNKFAPDMFDKAYLAFSQKIQSLYGDQYDMSNIKLKVDNIWLRIFDLIVYIPNYLSVATKNTLRYEKPSVGKILKGGYRVEVNMDLLPNITDDTYDTVEKKKEHGKSVFEFLEDGTLSNGTSYKLILGDIWVGHVHKESSGRHLDYSDFNVEITVKMDKDFPLTNEEKNEVEKMFKMYDVEILISKT